MRRLPIHLAGAFLTLTALSVGCGDDTTGNNNDSDAAVTACDGGQEELCDGVDNNCNGEIDEGCECLEGDTRACFSGDASQLGVGACRGGVQTCDLRGDWGTCVGEVPPTAEVCDGMDNDCDGVNDNGDPESGGSCDTGRPGACAAGVEHCVDGQLVCVPEQDPTELCDGVDNDCDPATPDGSEDPRVGVPCDGPDEDECLEGFTYCSGGEVLCDDETDDNVEVCAGDNVDENCDGRVDEGFVLDNNPPCSSLVDAGSVSGDTGTEELVYTGYNEEWIKVRIAETNNGIVRLSAIIELYSPDGSDFDLYVYCNQCGGPLVGSSIVAGEFGHWDWITVGAADSYGSDNGFDLIIEVRIKSVSYCGYWVLTVYGNQGPGDPHCTGG